MTYSTAIFNSNLGTVKTTMSGTLTLTSSSVMHQLLDPNGANRLCNLPTTGAAGQVLHLVNIGNSTYSIEVKDSGGSVYTLYYGEERVFTWEGSAWAGTFNPNELSGLLLNLDAAQGTFINTNFTSAATADGDLVGSWRDQGLKGFDVTGSSKPTLKLSQINSLPCLRFNGTANFLSSAKSFCAGPEVNAWGVVKRATWNAAGVHPIAGGSNWNTAEGFAHQCSDDTSQGMSAGVKITFGAGGYASNAPPFAAGLHNLGTSSEWLIASGRGGNQADVWINGTSFATMLKKSNNPVINNQTFQIGTYSSGGYSQYWDGDIAQYIVVIGLMSDADHTRMVRYLGRKFAITVA